MLKFVVEQRIGKFPSLNYMSVNFSYLSDNATTACCTIIVVHIYSNDKEMAKFVRATKKHPTPKGKSANVYIIL